MDIRHRLSLGDRLEARLSWVAAASSPVSRRRHAGIAEIGGDCLARPSIGFHTGLLGTRHQQPTKIKKHRHYPPIRFSEAETVLRFESRQDHQTDDVLLILGGRTRFRGRISGGVRQIRI
jgi:hypothetical protein